MKKLLLFFFTASVLFSCKKESKQNNISVKFDATLLVGKWNLVNDSVRNYKNGVLFESNNGGHTFNGEYYVEYKKDGSGTWNVKSTGPDHQFYIYHFFYSLNANILACHYPAAVVNGFPNDDHTEKFTLKALSNTDMINFYDETEKEANGDVIRYTEVSYYKKQ